MAKYLIMTKSAIFIFIIVSFLNGSANGEAASLVVVPNSENIRHNPAPILPPYDRIYSHAVETSGEGRFLHISGQWANTKSGKLPIDFRSQAIQSIQNIKDILESADMKLGDIVQMRFFLIDRTHTKELAEVRSKLLNGLAPAVTTLLVAGLHGEDWLIEIEALAFKPSARMKKISLNPLI